MFDLADITRRVKSGASVTPQEYAFLLANNQKAFWAFMIENNPGNINDTLRHQLGWTELKFMPDKAAIGRIITMMIDKGNKEELSHVFENFQLDVSKLSPSFIEAFKQQFES